MLDDALSLSLSLSSSLSLSLFLSEIYAQQPLDGDHLTKYIYMPNTARWRSQHLRYMVIISPPLDGDRVIK